MAWGCAWGKVQRRVLGHQRARGSIDPQRSLWPAGTQEPPYRLMIKSGKSNQARQEQVLSARRPQGWRWQGPQ